MRTSISLFLAKMVGSSVLLQLWLSVTFGGHRWMEQPRVSRALLWAAQRYSTIESKHNLRAQQCELSRLALDETFARVVGVAPTSVSCDRDDQRDKLTQTSFSESDLSTESAASEQPKGPPAGLSFDIRPNLSSESDAPAPSTDGDDRCLCRSVSGSFEVRTFHLGSSSDDET
jgi:hypothetical protein